MRPRICAAALFLFRGRLPGLGRRYWLLWTGLVVSRFGDGFLGIGVLWQVFVQTGSVMDLGLTFATYSAALAAGRLLLGPLADRHDRRRLMVTLDVTRAVLTVVPLLLTLAGALPVWVLAAVYVATGVLTTAYSPAASASLPQLVRGGALPRANRWLYGGSEAAHLIGPAVGGLMIAAVGAPRAMALDGISFLLCALCVVALPLGAGGGGAAPAGIAAGWREVRRSPILSAIAWLSATLWGTDTVFIVLFVPLVVTRLHGGAADVGLLEAAVSAGAIVASWLAGRWPSAWVWPAVPMFCLATAAMAVAPSMLWAYVLQALAGLFTATFMIPASVIYQQTAPDQLLGRAFAARGALTSASRSGAALLAGAVAAALGVAATFGAIGIAGFAVSGALVWMARRRDVLAA